MQIYHPKRKVVFQPSFFRGYVKLRGCMLNFGGVAGSFCEFKKDNVGEKAWRTFSWTDSPTSEYETRENTNTAEILIADRVLYIPGGAGFLPPALCIQEKWLWTEKHIWKSHISTLQRNNQRTRESVHPSHPHPHQSFWGSFNTRVPRSRPRGTAPERAFGV